MAVIQKRSGSFRVLFLHHGKRHAFTLGKVSQSEAEAKASQVDYLLMRIRQGLLTVPPAVDIVQFLRHDGKVTPAGALTPRDSVTLGQLRDRYLETHGNGTLEQTTLDGIKLHFKHLVATLGEQFPMQGLSLAGLQQHIDRRTKAKGIGGRLSPATIRKEIVTLRTAWNWGVQMELVNGRFPNKGIRYPKLDEKPPFQTWEEIERRITAGGLSKKEIADLWDALYLTQEDLKAILEHSRTAAIQPWVYPLFCFAAHTGARRSEMLRVQASDIAFDGGSILIHEKKRKRGQRTTRRVPLTPLLERALREWLAIHPGGPFLFAQATKVPHSKTKRTLPAAITRDEAHDHFKRTLAGSKWRVIRGYHIFRHSFISLCASQGVDQRLIDEWVGHTTEEQRKRYRHLLPSSQKQAILSVFGAG